MTLEELLELVKSGIPAEKLEEVTKGFDTVINNRNLLQEKLTAEQGKFSDVVKQRDTLKTNIRDNKTIFSKLGLEEEFKDTDIESLVHKLNSGKSGDELSAYVSQQVKEASAGKEKEYQDKLNTITEDKNKFQHKYQDTVVENSLLSIMEKNKISSNNLKYIAMDIRDSGLSFTDNGDVAFLKSDKSALLNEDGTTQGINDVFSSKFKNGDFDQFINVENRSGYNINGNGNNGGGQQKLNTLESITAGLENLRR